MRPLHWILAAIAALAALSVRAEAHPHVWIAVESTVLYEKGAFVGFRHKWTFDEFYTAMAIEGLDKNNDGKYDREELGELAKVNIDGLKDFAFFTFPMLTGEPLKTGEARDYWLEHKDGVLSLHFTLPLAQPVLAEAKAFTFSVGDPTYFIAFDFAKTDPVKLSEGAPKACSAKVGTPEPQGGGKTSALSESMSALGGLATVVANKVVSVSCNGS